jgi:hypothetical protein
MKYYNDGKVILNCFYGKTVTKKCFCGSYVKIHALYSCMKNIQEITEKKSDSDPDITYIDTDAVFVRMEKEE